MFQRMVGDFITGFQFLTRIRIVNQSEWSIESFGRSVTFFPIIGCIIGCILAGFAYGAQLFWGPSLPVHSIAIILIVMEVLVTGGLHCDGFMDTIDGVFSGRSRERMLEIMKDSRVGAFGAMGFCLLVLMKFSLILDNHAIGLPLVMFVMPVIGRTAIVIAITLFPYARNDGLGKLFCQPANLSTLLITGLVALIILVPLGKSAIIAGVAACVGAFVFAQYVSRRLGGLTGDVYGAVNEVAEVLALLVFVCLK